MKSFTRPLMTMIDVCFSTSLCTSRTCFWKKTVIVQTSDSNARWEGLVLKSFGKPVYLLHSLNISVERHLVIPETWKRDLMIFPIYSMLWMLLIYFFFSAFNSNPIHFSRWHSQDPFWWPWWKAINKIQKQPWSFFRINMQLYLGCACITISFSVLTQLLAYNQRL